MRKGIPLTICALAIIAPTAFANTYSESFSSGWLNSPDTPGTSFSVEGVINPADPGAATLDVADFGPADGRLGASNGSESGGFYYENGESGDGRQWDSGDNEMVYLDYHMSVANGVYTFTADVDAQLNWSTELQDWGTGYEFYIGDSAEMAYGSQLPHRAPDGPWQGKKWNGGANTAGTELLGGNSVIWTARDEFDNVAANNGVWLSHSFTANAAGNTINVTSGEVIFRFVIRLKNADQASPDYRSYAWDNLSVTLIPEPATGLLVLAAWPLFRRRRR